jgi:tripartite-type tricarboxylate transporter receptor subunit TctC
VIVNTLNRDINAILNAPNLQDMWTRLALTVIGGSASDAERYFEAERQKWRKVIEAADIHIE